MSNLINLGTVSNQNGQTSAAGLASGLDSTTLINAILQPQNDQVKGYQDTITLNGKVNSALSQFQTLLSDLQTTLDNLRGAAGVQNESTDFFKYTTSSVTSSTSTPASNYISVVSQAGASINSYNITNVVTAQAQLLRKDGFTSSTASVVGNSAVTDNYQANIGDFTGTALSSTPVQFANDTHTDGVATPASLSVFFSSDNKFDAQDSVTFGSTTITFGGTGGNDVDISNASTLDDKLNVVANQLNTITTGVESNYTYSVANGVITATQKTAGAIATVGNDLNVSADFSGGSDTTQKVGIGANYENNGSVAGSIAASNGPISGTLSQNGNDGIDASTQASINVQFGAQNSFDAGDSLTIGNKTLTFGGTGGDDLDLSGDPTLADKITHIANYLNSQTVGTSSQYTYSTNGSDTLTITRNAYGSNATVGTNLLLEANFSNGGDSTQTVKFGSDTASNTPSSTQLNVSGTDGVDTTSFSDAQTVGISTLSGAINLTTATPVFQAGTFNGTSYTPNSVVFKATVGGQTYTSKPVDLIGGSTDGVSGNGDNHLGNTIPAGTAITFVKDNQTGNAAGTQDVTFQLVTGDAATINNQAAATTYQQTTLNNALNVSNSVSIDNNSGTFTAGTFTLNGVPITLNAGDSLTSVESKINAVSGKSGVVADILQVSANSFSLTLKSANTGLINDIGEYGSGDPADPALNTIQIGGSAIGFTQQTAARDSSFDLDGVTITRSSNAISDAVSGVTFTLLGSTGADNPTLNVNIQHDTSTIETGVANFVSAYNNLKFFVAQQTQRDTSGNLVDTALLGNDQSVQTIMDGIQQQLTSVVAGISSGDPSSPFAAGLDFSQYPGDSTTPATSDILTVDQSALDSAIAANFSGFRNAFSFNFSSSSANLALYKSSNTSTLPNFKLDIDPSRAAGDQVRVLNATTGAFICNMDNSTSGLLSGEAGTPLAGLQLIYVGTTAEVIDVTATQGTADKLFNAIDTYLTPTTGLLATAVQGYTDQDTTLQSRIDTENAQIAAQKTQLTNKFTQLEAVISQANNTLSFLDAQTASDNKSSS